MASLIDRNHARSTFKNSCRTVPVTKKSPIRRKTRPATAPSISLPNISPGEDTADWTPLAGGGNDWSGPAVPKSNCTVNKAATSPNTFPNTSEAGQPLGQALNQKTDNYATLFQTLLESNCMLHKEISRLRQDHKKAMSRLAHFSRDHGMQDGQVEQCEQCGHAKGGASPRHSSYRSYGSSESKKSSISHGKPAKHIAETPSESEEDCYEPSITYDTPEEFHYDYSSHDDSEKHSRRSIEPYQITYISSSSSESMCSSQFASPRLLVGKMWENFSIGDYPVEDFCKAFPNAGGGNEKEWTRKGTVPEPFSMTVREGNNLSNKKKTKSMLIAEKELEEREALLDAKLKKPFHASPMPASTYLPLHGLINAKNAQRKELVKKMTGNMLKSSEKPFQFSKREEERKQRKAAWLKQAEEQNITRFRGKTFKAKPVPPKLFHSSVEEEAQELEEYRRIRTRIRAEELLAKSKSPFSLRQQGAVDSAHNQCIPKEHFRPHSRNRYSFQPQITHKVPDYDKAYEKLQRQLLLKKQAKLTTVSEPFKLHTEKRAKIRQPVDNANAQSDSGIEDKGEKVPLRPYSPVMTSPVITSPVMTATARRRRLLAQEKLAEAMLRDAVEEDQKKARKRRERDFQKMVAKKSFNVNNFLQEKKKKLKIHEFR